MTAVSDDKPTRDSETDPSQASCQYLALVLEVGVEWSRGVQAGFLAIHVAIDSSLSNSMHSTR